MGQNSTVVRRLSLEHQRNVQIDEGHSRRVLRATINVQVFEASWLEGIKHAELR